MPSVDQCARCGQTAPPQDSDEFSTWEALGETGEQVICEGCVTVGESQAMSDDMTLMQLDPDVPDPE